MSSLEPEPDALVNDDLDVVNALEELGMSIEELDAELEASTGASVALVPLFMPESGLEQRVTDAVVEKLRRRETALLIGDLFGLGWQTLRAVIETDDGGPDHG